MEFGIYRHEDDGPCSVMIERDAAAFVAGNAMTLTLEVVV